MGFWFICKLWRRASQLKPIVTSAGVLTRRDFSRKVMSNLMAIVTGPILAHRDRDRHHHPSSIELQTRLHQLEEFFAQVEDLMRDCAPEFRLHVNGHAEGILNV